MIVLIARGGEDGGGVKKAMGKTGGYTHTRDVLFSYVWWWLLRRCFVNSSGKPFLCFLLPSCVCFWQHHLGGFRKTSQHPAREDGLSWPFSLFHVAFQRENYPHQLILVCLSICLRRMYPGGFVLEPSYLFVFCLVRSETIAFVSLRCTPRSLPPPPPKPPITAVDPLASP